MNLAEFWPLCLRRLHQTLTPQLFETWIAPLTVGEENGVWVVYGKNQFGCNMLKNQFAAKLEAVRAELCPQQPPLCFKVGKGVAFAMAAAEPVAAPAKEAATKNQTETNAPVAIQAELVLEPLLPNTQTTKPTKKSPTKKQSAQDILAARLKKLPLEGERKRSEAPVSQTSQPSSPMVIAAPTVRTRKETSRQFQQTNLAPEYTFATLVEGKGNRLATSAAKSIINQPASNYNPFFVYGSTGLGKTHLVQAIGNELLRQQPEAKVHYIHADEYVRSVMKAARNQSFDDFKQRYCQYDLLIIDDIQFIKGKNRTMEEFFHLYNHFHAEKKQLILTCDVPPASIRDMNKLLQSRLSWGLSLELEPPEFDERVAILQKKAEIAGVPLSRQAAEFIAKHIRSNVRELEGAFKRVEARSRFQNKRIDVPLITDALPDIVFNIQQNITPEVIMEMVAKHYRIQMSDLLGKKRTRNIARPRQIAMALTKELAELSLAATGKAFGDRDHTTVMHAIKAVDKLREEDAEIRQDYLDLLHLLQT